MTVLIDTHVLLWWIGVTDRELPPKVDALLSKASTRIVVSAAVVWEISIKRALGKLEAPENLVHFLEHAGISTLPVSASHAQFAGSLPSIHRDPFDRMLVAQASTEGLPIVTADIEIAQYDVETIWN